MLRREHKVRRNEGSGAASVEAARAVDEADPHDARVRGIGVSSLDRLFNLAGRLVVDPTVAAARRAPEREHEPSHPRLSGNARVTSAPSRPHRRRGEQDRRRAPSSRRCTPQLSPERLGVVVGRSA
jgi:hypothetical protein